MKADLAPGPDNHLILAEGKNRAYGQVLIYTKASQTLKM